jgi:hypothetical protein
MHFFAAFAETALFWVASLKAVNRKYAELMRAEFAER